MGGAPPSSHRLQGHKVVACARVSSKICRDSERHSDEGLKSSYENSVAIQILGYAAEEVPLRHTRADDKLYFIV